MIENLGHLTSYLQAMARPDRLPPPGARARAWGPVSHGAGGGRARRHVANGTGDMGARIGISFINKWPLVIFCG